MNRGVIADAAVDLVTRSRTLTTLDQIDVESIRLVSACRGRSSRSRFDRVSIQLPGIRTI
jgi:hypothetical protein